MSPNFVMLVLKTNIYKSKLIVIQHFASLVSEHNRSDTDFLNQTPGLQPNPQLVCIFLTFISPWFNETTKKYIDSCWWRWKPHGQ